MKSSPIEKVLRIAAIGLAMCHATHAAELLNGDFNSGKANWVGSFNAGDQGGNGWSSGYFDGGYPTNNTFATTVNGPIRQNISGSANTFVEGTTYTVSMAIFGSSNYATTAAVMWGLGFTADGTVVANDHWFSEEWTPSTVGAGNGGTIPDDHITTVGGGSTGLKTVTLTYTATAADAGKVIGIQLGGNQSKYTVLAGLPADVGYYGMMDSVTFAVIGVPTISTFSSEITVIDGMPFHLEWDIADPAYLTGLTLDDGSGPVSVLADTDPLTGHGDLEVDPTQNTTYTLTANGGSSRSLTITNGKINSFTSNTILATGPDYQTTLSWSVQPGEPVSVTISDGTTTTDVTADTSGGYGSRVFTVPTASTTYTLDVNNGSVTRTLKVLRAVPGDPDRFSLNLETVYAGESLTASWQNAGNASGSWVAIYKKSDLIGVQFATTWQYISAHGGATGSNTFGGLPPGEYYAVLFVDGNYTIEQGPVHFTVSALTRPPVAPFAVTSSTRVGNSFSVTWNSEPGATYDVYASSDLVNWDLIEDNKPSGGTSTTTTEDLSTLPNGVPAARYYRVAR